MMLFNELRKHGKLAAKRHPMYDKNRFGKYAMYAMAVFWAAYLIFFGTTFAFAFDTNSMEPYHIMNSGLVFVLALDFILRFPLQKTPTQEVKPYLLMPVRRNRVIDFLLIRSGLSSYNLIWLFMFAPFAIITIPKFFGLWGVLTYCAGIWLLMVFNNYWFLLCRTLISERIWWVLLPLAIYGGIAAAIFIPEDKSVVANLFIDLGEGYIEGNLLAFIGTLAAIALMWLINRKLMAGLVYAELNKVEDTKVNASEYKFFEKYGEVGEYMRLELKMLLRNKVCKNSLRMGILVVIAFSLLLSFTEVYDGTGMKNFITVYNFAIFGILFLLQIMSYEGMRDAVDLVVVDHFGLIVEGVGDLMEVLAGDVDRAAVGQVATVGKVHAHEGVAGLEHSLERGQVGGSAGVGLDVGMLSAEQLAGALTGDLFGLVDAVAAAVVALAGIALGVLVGQARAHSHHDSRGDDVFGGDQLDVALLAVILLLNSGADFGVILGQEFHGFFDHGACSSSDFSVD